MGQIRNAYKILVGKREWKMPLGRLRHTWEDNIEKDNEEISCEDVDRIQPTQNKIQFRAVVNTVMSLWVT
jgi:hypothetical protein